MRLLPAPRGAQLALRITIPLLVDLVFLAILHMLVAPQVVQTQIAVALLVGTSIGLGDYSVSCLGQGARYGLITTIAGLIVTSTVTILVCLMTTDPLVVSGAAGLSLSLNTLLWTDLFVDGAYDAWLWPLRNRHIGAFRRWLSARLVLVVSGIFLFGIASYVIAFFKLWLLLTPGTGKLDWLLDIDWITNPQRSGRVGLVLLLAIILWITTTSLVAARKYQLHTAAGPLWTSTKSLYLLRRLFSGPNKPTANEIIKQIQCDQLLWAGILTGGIALAEVGLFLAFRGDGLLFNFLFFMTPVTMVLLFGLVGHTSSAELGGVYGVLLAACMMGGMSRVMPAYRWNAEMFFFIFASAIVAWIIGLLGGIFIRGTQQMSLLALVVRAEHPAAEMMLLDLRHHLGHALETGYRIGADDLFGNAAPTHMPARFASGPLVGSGTRSNLLIDDELAFSISCKQVPLICQIYYALCFNRLVWADLQGREKVRLPNLPLGYYHPGSRTPLDLPCADTMQYRLRLPEPLSWQSLPRFVPGCSSQHPHGYHRDASEFFDTMLTLSLDMRTDLYCRLIRSATGPSQLELVMVCRGQTSTKSYVTLEAEVLAARAAEQILSCLRTLGFLCVAEQRARVFYPSLSITDHEASGQGGGRSGMQAAQAAFSSDHLQVLRESLRRLPNQHATLDFTQKIREQIPVTLTELGLTGLVALANLNPSIQQAISTIVNLMFS